MTKKWMAVLALTLVAPAAFGQTAVTAPSAGQVKILREEIKRDKTDLTAKWKSARAVREQLTAQMKAEAAKLKTAEGTRAEKAAARKALRLKYANLMKEARAKNARERRALREDMASKSALVKRLRQS